jgi:hypothetical protein
MPCSVCYTMCSVLRLLVTVNGVPSSPILVILMMEAICSSRTSVFARATRCNIPKDGNLQTDDVSQLSLRPLYATARTLSAVYSLEF